MGPTECPVQWVPGALSRIKSGQLVWIVLGLRMGGAVSPFPTRLVDYQKENSLLTTITLNFSSFSILFYFFLDVFSYRYSVSFSSFLVLYGCVTWSLTLRDERSLRVFENRVLRRVFGPKRDEVTGEWRKLHIEELSDLYSLPNIVRVVKSRRM